METTAVSMDVWKWIDSNGELIFWVLSVSAVVAGIGILYWIYSHLPEKNGFVHDIPKLISGIAHKEVKAHHHVIAGVMLFSGVSVIAGLMTARLFGVVSVTVGSFSSTNSGLVLGVLTLVLALWTLHQTKKLERLQGDGIKGFDTLIVSLTETLQTLKARFDQSNDKMSRDFRLYIVTNNPYFGINSYPSERVATDYSHALTNLADTIRVCRTGGSAEMFKVKIICANPDTLAEFNAEFQDRNAKSVDWRTSESELLIQKLEANIGADSVLRLPMQLPSVQFIIIGNVTYEFMLEANDSWGAKARGSNIMHTTRIDDGRVADRYEGYVQFLEDMATMPVAPAGIREAEATE